MKILLVQQYAKREPRTPIALMDLACYGRALGHDVDVTYADEAKTYLVGDASHNYDLVGFSALSFASGTILAIAELRKMYPGRIVFGGKASSVLQPEDFTKLEQLGVKIALGSGETALFHPNQEIDYCQYPSWDKADFEALDRNGFMTEMMSSRGCPYHCHFCHNTEKKMRFFPLHRTIANASLVLNTMKRERIFLVDDVFAIQASRMLATLQAADAQGLDLRQRTRFFVHINHINKDTVEAIEEYNPQEVQVGIESGSDRMLKAMGKTFTAEQASGCLRWMYSCGIKVACLFLMGFPGETKASLQATIDFVERNRMYMSGWWVSYYQPVPFTVGWEMAKERVDGKLVCSGWNTDINYLDPNLTMEDLQQARKAVMQD